MESNYINLIPERYSPVFHVSKGDTGRSIRCNLYNGSCPVKLTGAENIRMRYRKANGDVSSISVPNTESTYLEITIPDDVTNAAGRVYCKLNIDGISAKAFIIEVEGGI